MKSKRVINAKLPYIGTQVPDNGTKDLLAFFSTMMASAMLTLFAFNGMCISCSCRK